MSGVQAVFQRKGEGLVPHSMQHHQLDFHFFGNDAFDIYAHQLAAVKPWSGLGQSREIWGEFYEHTVGLHAAHQADHCFTGGKGGGVFQPGAQQLFHRQHNTPFGVPAFYGTQDILAFVHTVGRALNTGHGHTVDGKKSRDPAADVAKGTEALQMRHPAGQDVAGQKQVEILGFAALLRLCA